MVVSGFTFLRDAVSNGYPFEESIRSLLPIVDEYIVAVGISGDDTLERIRAIGDPKIRVIETSWNEKMQDRGYVYGQQKMIAQFNCNGDWAFYLEGDEVLHEDDLQNIRSTMDRYRDDPEVEALYFDFLHFYGTPSQVGIAGYRRAPRIIKNSVRSIAPDGLFFVILDGNKRGRYPRARYAGASIYHYGHCRKIEFTNRKLRQVGKFWGAKHDVFTTYGKIDVAELRPFAGSHPEIMADWLNNSAELTFEPDESYRLTRRDLRNRLRFWVEERFGLEISKKHYKDLGH